MKCLSWISHPTEISNTSLWKRLAIILILYEYIYGEIVTFMPTTPYDCFILPTSSDIVICQVKECILLSSANFSNLVLLFERKFRMHLEPYICCTVVLDDVNLALSAFTDVYLYGVVPNFLIKS